GPGASFNSDIPVSLSGFPALALLPGPGCAVNPPSWTSARRGGDGHAGGNLPQKRGAMIAVQPWARPEVRPGQGDQDALRLLRSARLREGIERGGPSLVQRQRTACRRLGSAGSHSRKEERTGAVPARAPCRFFAGQDFSARKRREMGSAGKGSRLRVL